MRLPSGWFLVVVAAIAVAIAIWAGPNLTIAIPAAAFATLAGGLLFVGAWLELEEGARRRTPSRWEPDVFRLRSAMRSGPLGREEIVTTLDRVERMGPTPDLPARSPQQMELIVRLPPAEFRKYLRGRLDDLEARM
jgi:hypothetical protein